MEKYKLNQKLNFGKYKSKTIKEIINNDINYIIWCIKNIENFNLDHESIIEFINNKEKIAVNNNLISNDIIEIALGNKEGNVKDEFNKMVGKALTKR